MTPWLLVDFGDVISRPYDDDSYRTLAALLDLDATHLRSTYWQHRRAYDAGEPSAAYWSKVAGRGVPDDLAERLDAADVAAWSRTDPQMLALLAEQRHAGARLALLSNAPHVQAAAFDRADWAPMFEHLLTSSRLGVAKPDPAAFTLALATLRATPGDVTFVDDRPENVDAAAGLGIRTILYAGVENLRGALSQA